MGLLPFQSNLKKKKSRSVALDSSCFLGRENLNLITELLKTDLHIQGEGGGGGEGGGEGGGGGGREQGF